MVNYAVKIVSEGKKKDFEGGMMKNPKTIEENKGIKR